MRARQNLDSFNPIETKQPAFLVQEVIARDPGVPRGAAILYGRMARFQAKGGICYASVEYLASELGAGERTVNRWLGALVGRGYIRRTYVSGFRTKVTVFLGDRFPRRPVENASENFPSGTPEVAHDVRHFRRTPSISSELEDLGKEKSDTHHDFDGSQSKPVEIPQQLELFATWPDGVNDHRQAKTASTIIDKTARHAATGERYAKVRPLEDVRVRSTPGDALQRAGLFLLTALDDSRPP